MEKIKKFSPYLILLIIFIVLIFNSFPKKKLEIISKSLVYLIPEDYFGPVFVFFGQKDGVELLPDPLGHSVSVPENGVIKIKEDVDSALPKQNPAYQNVYWVSVSKSGARKKMIFNENT